jgi:hypothetical protein
MGINRLFRPETSHIAATLAELKRGGRERMPDVVLEDWNKRRVAKALRMLLTTEFEVKKAENGGNRRISIAASEGSHRYILSLDLGTARLTEGETLLIEVTGHDVSRTVDWVWEAMKDDVLVNSKACGDAAKQQLRNVQGGIENLIGIIRKQPWQFGLRMQET